MNDSKPDYDSQGDEPLVELCRRGDRRAFEELVRRTARLVYSRLYLETRDPHRAEDLTQETFLSAWKSIHQLAENAGFRSWLLTIARSTSRDAYRRETRKKRGGFLRLVRRSTPSEPEEDVFARLTDAGPTPIEAIERREECERVLDALKAMPEEYRLPIALRYIGGADYETIGRQLGLSNGSLRGLLNRGMNKLRQSLRRESATAEAEASWRGPS